MEIKNVAVIGAGTMGAGIAQRASQSKFSVYLHDLKEEYIEKGFKTIKSTLEEGIKRGKVKKEKLEEIIGNIKGTTDLNEAVKNADIVIEAVFEDLDIKKNVFKNISKICSNETIIVTNTSSLSVTELGKSVLNQSRFAGLHFFFPSAINRLVEVIAGIETSKETLETLVDFSRQMGKIPILAKDSPGFVVNRFFVPWLNEACKILEEGIANISTIDKSAKQGFSIGMGPFELMNATGIPIAYYSEKSLEKRLGDFYKPSKVLEEQFKSKKLWDLDGEVNEKEISNIINRFYAVVFSIACNIVEEGIAKKEDVDRGATIGLRWKVGPFALMNKIGIEKSYEIVKNYVKISKGIKIPKSLEERYKLGKGWFLKNVEVKKHGKIAIIIMNRPEAMNALNSKILIELENAVIDLQKDKDILAVLITGEGNAFVAGADIKEMIEKSPIEAREFTYLGQEVFKKLENLEKVVIACVNGFALGGGLELALACDLIIASEKAKFGLPEVGLGIHPGFGGTQRLPRLIGKNRAKELIFTGDTISAKEALEIGLVNKVVPQQNLMKEAIKIANKISSKGPIAIKLAKKVVNRGIEEDLNSALALEMESVSMCFGTEDRLEGMRAFIEKRNAEFRNK